MGARPEGGQRTDPARDERVTAESSPAPPRSPQLILASTSPRRQRLLGEQGLTFVVEPPPVAEEDLDSLDFEPPRIAEHLALAKALSVARRANPLRLPVLGADTLIVAADGQVIGKPLDRADARRILLRLSGQPHQVITGVALVWPDREPAVENEVSVVRFRGFDGPSIEPYLDSGDWLGKAGAYGIQSAGRGLVESFCGCYANIVGLPVLRVLRMLGHSNPHAELCGCARHPLQHGERGCGIAF